MLPALSRSQVRSSRRSIRTTEVEVLRVDGEKLADRRGVERTAATRARVQGASELQARRFTGTKLTYTAEMGPAEARVLRGGSRRTKSLKGSDAAASTLGAPSIGFCSWRARLLIWRAPRRLE
jgi:hypothetical protein